MNTIKKQGFWTKQDQKSQNLPGALSPLTAVVLLPLQLVWRRYAPCLSPPPLNCLHPSLYTKKELPPPPHCLALISILLHIASGLQLQLHHMLHFIPTVKSNQFAPNNLKFFTDSLRNWYKNPSWKPTLKNKIAFQSKRPYVKTSPGQNVPKLGSKRPQVKTSPT